MRNHVQGIGLLAALAAAIWVIAWMAAPAVGDAFGEDGAVRAESFEDVIDLSSDSQLGALTESEIYGIQYLLTLEGYETRGIDGTIGPGTRAAIDQAKSDYGLGPEASDRDLYDYFIDRRDDTADADTEAEPVATDVG